MYLSPENKKNRVKLSSCLEILKEDVQKFSEKGSVFLLGDFNARVKDKEDFVQVSKFNYDLCDNQMPDIDKKIQNTFAELHLGHDEKGDNYHRNSEDSSPASKRGNELIQLCKDLNLSILNGRTVGDLFGKITCFRWNGCSVVDYAICSKEAVHKVTRFSVGSHLPWVSDHSPIELFLDLSECKDKTKNKVKFSKQPPTFIWEEESKERFQNILRADSFSQIIHDILNNLENEKFTYPLIQLKNILFKAANDANVKNKIARTINEDKNTNKSWFDTDCEDMKKKLLELTKDMITDPKNHIKRLKVTNKKKEFKKTIKRKKADYEQKCIDSLQGTFKEKKKFWKILDKMRKNKSPDYVKHISPNTIVSYFQNLFKSRTLNRKVSNVKTSDMSKSPITFDEVKIAIQNSNANSACGIDSIDFFMIKSVVDIYPELLPKIFTNILNSGVYPTEWKTSILIPIHKKGSKTELSNYRGISLLSSVSKIFSSILNNRIIKWSLQENILSQGQLGFLKGNRTSDALLIVHNIINRYCKKMGQKCFSCLVDFQKAFDNIPHDLLMNKLKKLGIDGNIFNIINSMYTSNKCKIRVGQKLSPEISVEKGVRQGCVLSPTLFNLFLSDFEPFIKENCSMPVHIDEHNIMTCILWADDILLISETKQGLQYQLDQLSIYCKSNEITVNADKTKCICFNSSGRLIRNCLNIDGNILEDVKSIRYLGFVITSNGSVNEGLVDLRNRAKNAYYKLRRDLGSAFKKNVSLALQLFDILIKPIMLYASDFWGMNKLNTFQKNPCEKVHTDMCKQILGVSSSTSNTACLLELGRVPISLQGRKNSLNNWLRIKGKQSCNKLVLASCNMAVDEELTWASEINISLQDIGMNLTWNHPDLFPPKGSTSKNFYNYMSCDFYDHAYRKMKSSTKYKLFHEIKNKYGQLSDYLTNIKDLRYRRALSKLRLADNDLEINLGRYKNVPLQDRICKICKCSIEDEVHFMVSCIGYTNLRATVLEEVGTIDTTVKSLKGGKLCIALLRSQKKHGNAVAKFLFEALAKRKEIFETMWLLQQ